MRILVCGLLASLVLGADVTAVKTVYLLPMSGGLDQYLANRLTGSRMFRVVTDPKLADAIFTDQIGEGFEQKLSELYTDPDADPDEKDDNNSKPLPHPSAFGRGRGAIFLVDVKSHAVIWSLYAKRVGSKPEVLDRAAVHIVQQLKKQK